MSSAFPIAAQNGLPENRIVNYSAGKDFNFLVVKDGATYYALPNDGTNEHINPITGYPRPTPDPADKSKGYRIPDDVLAGGSSSLYSGMMRLAVGCYHSRGVRSPFGYAWAKTHGILKLGDAYWIAEVSASGVYAAPITYSGRCFDSWRIANYMPTQQQLDANPALSEFQQDLSLAWAFTGRPDQGVLRLLVADDMAAAYAQSPFYAGHGWAFNHSGNECQAVTASYLLTPAPRYNCCRYKISFSGDGGSVAAVLSVVEQGKPAAFARGQVWIPNGPGQWEGTHRADTPSLAAYPNQDAPIHVYYAGDEEIVCRFKLTNHADAETDVTLPPVPGHGGFGYYNFYSVKVGQVPWFEGSAPYAPTTLDIYEQAMLPESHNYIYSAGQQAGFSSPHFDGFADARAYDKTQDVFEIDGGGSFSQQLGSRCGVPDSAFTRFDVNYEWFYGIQVRTRNIGANSGASCLVLLASDREAVLHVDTFSDSVRQVVQHGTEVNGNNPTFNQGQFTATITWSVADVNNCGLSGFTTAPSGNIWPMGFHASLVDISDTTSESGSAEYTLCVGGAVFDGAIGDNADLSTFTRPGSVSTILTATSSVVAKHGNLYHNDATLTPPGQFANSARKIKSDELLLVGGFVSPAAEATPLAFVGKS